MKDLAENFSILDPFLRKLDEELVGGSTTQTLLNIMSNSMEELKIDLALTMDLEILCSTTYRLEGDGLEILLVHDELEALRERGRMLGSNASTLPNVAAILRAKQPISIGLATIEYYGAPYHQYFKGKVSAIGANSNTWTITYADADGSSLLVADENEMRQAIDVCALPQWRELVDKVANSYKYLEDRLTDQCAAPYHCREQHRVTGILRAFNPALLSARSTTCGCNTFVNCHHLRGSLMCMTA